MRSVAVFNLSGALPAERLERSDSLAGLNRAAGGAKQAPPREQGRRGGGELPVARELLAGQRPGCLWQRPNFLAVLVNLETDIRALK